MFSSAVMAVSGLASSTQPDAIRTPDADTVSPGFAGFLAVFFIAVATVLLIRSMTKHMRKVKFMADQVERTEAEAAGSAVAAGAPAGPGSAPAGTPPEAASTQAASTQATSQG
ncbi:hypothetical protein LR393_19360 [Kineosporia mesophila]|uniref:hypothetical protein n=1 Tax=Kineosporia mesophila TaxID=566012 RepID=UPI001E541D7E|nr:hypothetical protein [Kineosporia mesophila]MCD5352229.1 hypothetical protein [Kineosporia mesophila]